MSFSPTEFRKELAELRLPKGRFARAINVNATYVSEYLSGLRVPTDEVTRRILFVFTFIREHQMTGAGFALDAAGIRLLQKKIKDM
jgi:hypothetical protein